MITHRRIVVLVAALLAAGTIVRAALPDESWVGEAVLPTKPAKEVTFGDVIEGKQVYFPFSGMNITVRGDRDGWLRIHDGHREGWALKADFVPVRDAPAYFHRRVQANPKDTWALFMRGVGWRQKGEPDNAIQDFNECIRLNPTDAAAFISRGNAWFDKKEYDKAIRDDDEAIRLDPMSLAFVTRGIVWHAKKEYDKAIRDYDEAIRLDSKYALAFVSRGNARRDKKEYDKAIRDYDEAIRLDSKYALAFVNRGNVWLDKKDYDKAIRDYDEAIRLDPKEALPFNNLAWLMATCPEAQYRDGQRAVELARKACELTSWKMPLFVGTLAAAYAEAGDFNQAAKCQKQALESGGSAYERQYGEIARKLLKLYELKQPYRE